MTFTLTVFGGYALWLGLGVLAVARVMTERKRMLGMALPVLGVLAGMVAWTRQEESSGSHLPISISLFGWLALALFCTVVGLVDLRSSPGASWALLYPPALVLLVWLSGVVLSLLR